MNIELKPCPFCGSEAELYSNYNNRIKVWFVYVRCEMCGAQGKTFTNNMYLEPDEEEFWNTNKVRLAADAWNRRVR